MHTQHDPMHATRVRPPLESEVAPLTERIAPAVPHDPVVNLFFFESACDL
eukprot:GDKH01003664.1.p2 GENE.GDKH01003664.1~~GDKH01003664.1.p2  ORF type:complete len:50 (+),score=2.77 GDKH01003664.1:163-312(+)